MAQENVNSENNSDLQEKICVFCNLVSGKLPCFKVFENTRIMAFAPTNETIIAQGHLLVIPKKHFKDIFDIPKEELFRLIDGVKTISKKLKVNCNADEINILSC